MRMRHALVAFLSRNVVSAGAHMLLCPSRCCGIATRKMSAEELRGGVVASRSLDDMATREMQPLDRERLLAETMQEKPVTVTVTAIARPPGTHRLVALVAFTIALFIVWLAARH